ncbi:chondroitinase-B domain-containing protein [Tamlana sp. 2_MG-2023]|uniref:chondroitinase-B domain-containing protein n=1 Tax=unclassified Tamlana TaxID=2614803 RepID=UPI0026E3B0BC|nr:MULTISPECIES: chondroitinase-B domain-containing protein [unclassified Tamlana]MDO6760476.1 chondroitinase-B domain-containing protein [Tamlana sp. 2_MG-2023]MDO6790732.1 chondroitinase-B domain-containing protein [Tamlana sp. 1_MG-2023]
MSKNFTLLRKGYEARTPLKFFFTIAFLCFSYLSIGQNMYDDDYDLRTAVNAAGQTGGTFIVKNGEYSDFQPAFEVEATAANPIIVKAETVGGVKLTGSSRFNFRRCAYITMEGFIFENDDNTSMVKTEGCNNIRISRNVFEYTGIESCKFVYIGGVWDDIVYPFNYPSHNNRIDHNIFQNKKSPGHYITIDGSNDDATSTSYQSQYDRIDHNYFVNNGPRAVNEQESIRVGWSEMSLSSGFTTVEYNLFEECDGDPEIVSIKSCDNTVRFNTFIGSYGTLSFRHGNRNRAEGNFFFGNNRPQGLSPDGADLYTGGIRIYGKDHVIINNYMEGLNGTRWDAPIALTKGDAIDGQSSSLSKHFRAENVLIAYNTLVNNSHGIEIGYDNNGKYGTNLSNITIANNLITGSENALVDIIDGNDQGSAITWKNNLMQPTGTAVTLNGATSTSFDATNVVEEDPNLAPETVNTFSLFKTTATSPVYAHAATEAVGTDIEGQDRPSNSNPGADHFSSMTATIKPLTSSDVGPYVQDDGSVSEIMYVTSLATYVAAGEAQDVTVTSNVNWTATTMDSWISIAPASGSDNGTFAVTASENTTYSERSGEVTVTGGALTRTITVTQEMADPRANLNLINPTATDVSVYSVTYEEVDASKNKNNIAEHSLDKDLDTYWASNKDLDPAGSGKSIIIYDLEGAFDLDLIDIATSSGKTYMLQIWVSTSGVDDGDFTNIFGDIVTTTDGDMQAFMPSSPIAGAKYVKIIGDGQPSSKFTSIHEIEFYTSQALSVNDFDTSAISVYPVPAKEVLNIKTNGVAVNTINVYGLDGRLVLNKVVENSNSGITLNTSSLSNGTYVVRFTNTNGLNESRMIVVSH